MSFRSHPFPPGTPSFAPHEAVLKYLLSYASLHNLAPRVRFATPVTRVRKRADSWLVSTASADLAFDYVLIAVGQYTSPNQWRPAGASVFAAAVTPPARPRTVEHSHAYKTPRAYAGRHVLVVGAGPSGADIALELSRAAASVRVAHARARDDVFHGAVREVAPLARLTGRGEAVLQDGTVLEGIDDVVLCTGYRYNYPFLKQGEAGVRVAPDGRSVRGLTAHLYARDDSSLAMMGLVWKVIPFPLFEDQAAFLSALWGGRVSGDALRTLEAAEDEDWGAALLGEQRYLHRLGARQWEYRRRLDSASGEAMPEISKIEIARDASAARQRDFTTYREREYVAYGEGPGEWRVFEEGIDITGRDDPGGGQVMPAFPEVKGG